MRACAPVLQPPLVWACAQAGASSSASRPQPRAEPPAEPDEGEEEYLDSSVVMQESQAQQPLTKRQKRQRRAHLYNYAQYRVFLDPAEHEAEFAFESITPCGIVPCRVAICKQWVSFTCAPLCLPPWSFVEPVCVVHDLVVHRKRGAGTWQACNDVVLCQSVSAGGCGVAAAAALDRGRRC